MSRMRRVALACFFVFFVRGGVGVDAPEADGGEPCKLATKGDSIVAKACRKGGFTDARKLMREMRTVVNKSGPKVECVDCHDHADDARYDTLTKDGRERFKAFLTEYDKKK